MAVNRTDENATEDERINEFFDKNLGRQIHYSLEEHPDWNLAAFDLDGTIIDFDLRDVVLDHMVRRQKILNTGLLGEGWDLGLKDERKVYHDTFRKVYHTLLEQDNRPARERAFELFTQALAGYTPLELEQIIDSSLKENANLAGEGKAKRDVSLVPSIPKVMNLMQGLLRRGVHVYIITSAPQYLAEPLVNTYIRPKLKNTNGYDVVVQGIQTEIDPKGKVTPVLLQPTTMYDGKVYYLERIMEELGVKKPVVVGGDSFVDLPMLKKAHIPVLVYRVDVHPYAAMQELCSIVGKRKGYIIEHHKREKEDPLSDVKFFPDEPGFDQGNNPSRNNDPQ